MLINTVWFIPYLTISTFFFPRSLSFCVHLLSSISRSAAHLAHTNALEKWWKTENGFAKFKTRFKWMLRVWAVAGFAILGVSMMYDDVANFWVAEIVKILFHFGLFKGKHIKFSAFDTQIVEYFPLNSIWLENDFHIQRIKAIIRNVCACVWYSNANVVTYTYTHRQHPSVRRITNRKIKYFHNLFPISMKKSLQENVKLLFLEFPS